MQVAWFQDLAQLFFKLFLISTIILHVSFQLVIVAFKFLQNKSNRRILNFVYIKCCSDVSHRDCSWLLGWGWRGRLGAPGWVFGGRPPSPSLPPSPSPCPAPSPGAGSSCLGSEEWSHHHTLRQLRKTKEIRMVIFYFRNVSQWGGKIKQAAHCMQGEHTDTTTLRKHITESDILRCL